MERVPVNDKIRHAAQQLLNRNPAWLYSPDRARLRKIVSGELQSVDADWWRKLHFVTRRQVEGRLKDKAERKLRKIKAMADPALNPNEHQRRVAEATLTKHQAKLQAEIDGVRPPSAPGLEEYDRGHAKRRPPRLPSLDELLKARAARRKAPAPVNTTKPKPEAVWPTIPFSVDGYRRHTQKPAPVNTTKAGSCVNTTTKKPRTADRHREPNRDRHSPGYMRDYMRRRRAATRRANP
jgi:hypothetical protein